MYLAENKIVASSSPSPFGTALYNRGFSFSGGYRYGFNGKENDDDVKGKGNQQNYGERIYDPRLGKFLSPDPLARKYPMLSTYQFASNRPIDGMDLDGLEYTQASSFRLQYHTPMYSNMFDNKTATTIKVQTNQTTTLGITKNTPDFYKANPIPVEFDPAGQHDHPNGTITPTPIEAFPQPDAPDGGVSGKNGTNPYLPSNDKVGVLVEGIKQVTKGIAYLVDKNHIDAQSKIEEDGLNLNRAISLVGKFSDKFGLKLSDKVKTDLINYVNDGSLPNNNTEGLTKQQAVYNSTIQALGKTIFEKKSKFGYSKKNDKEFVKSTSNKNSE